MKALRWLFAVVIFLCALPVLAMLAATTVADAAGCRVDESGAHPCVILGADVGGMLYAGFTSAWYSFVTLPVGAVVACIWLAAEATSFIVRRRRAG